MSRELFVFNPQNDVRGFLAAGAPFLRGHDAAEAARRLFLLTMGDRANAGAAAQGSVAAEVAALFEHQAFGTLAVGAFESATTAEASRLHVAAAGLVPRLAVALSPKAPAKSLDLAARALKNLAETRQSREAAAKAGLFRALVAAASAITRPAPGSDEYLALRSCVVDAGAVAALLAWATTPSSRVVDEALAVVLALTASPEGRAQIVAAGGPSVLGRLLGETDSPAALQRVLKTLNNVCVDPAGVAAVAASPDAIYHAFDLMMVLGQDSPLFALLAQFLSNALRGSSVSAVVKDVSGIETVVTALRHAKDAALREVLLSILGNLLCDSENVDTCLEENVPKLFVAQLSPQNTPGILQEVLRGIVNATGVNEPFRMAIIDAGGLKALVGLLNSNAPHEIRVLALNALKNLSLSSERAQAFKDKALITDLNRTLQAGDLTVKTLCLSLMGNISMHEVARLLVVRIATTTQVASLLQAQDRGLKLAALRVLTIFTVEGRVRKWLSEHPAELALVERCAGAGQDAEVQAQAGVVLGNMKFAFEKEYPPESDDVVDTSAVLARIAASGGSRGSARKPVAVVLDEKQKKDLEDERREEEERRRLREEEQRKVLEQARLEQELQRERAEKEARKRREEEERRRSDEAARKAEEERKRREEEARRAAEEQARREEEARARKKAEDEAKALIERLQAMNKEAEMRAAAAKLQREQEQRAREQEIKRQQAEQLRVEEEKRRAEEEERERRRQEREEARKRYAEQKRLEREKAEREEAARRIAEEEAKLRAIEEERRAAEEQARREEEAQRRHEEEQRRAAETAERERKAKAEAQRKAQEEEERKGKERAEAAERAAREAAQKLAVVKEQQKRDELERQRLAAEEEIKRQRRAAEELARKKVELEEEERRRKKAEEEEAARKKAESDAELKKKVHQRRTYIVREMYDTEKTYIDGIKHVILNFLRPLNEMCGTPGEIVPRAAIKAMFSNIEVIANFNSVLLDKLGSRLANWNETTPIGDVFIMVTVYLRSYVEYVNNYENATSTLSRLRKENLAFQQFLDTTEKARPDLALNSVLIFPVQRVPRYILLLADLLKHTPAEHPDYANLQKAVAEMKSTGEYINERKRDAENMAKLSEVQSHLRGKFPTLIAPNRRFVADTPFMLYKTPSSSGKHAHLFVFNDVVVVGRPTGKGRYNYKGSVSNESVVVTERVADVKNAEHCMRLQNQASQSAAAAKDERRVWTLAFGSDADRSKWASQINSLKDECMKRRHTLHK
eukprot:m51a1_g13737 putative domain containing protein (1263) ;mRNA; r:156087-161140